MNVKWTDEQLKAINLKGRDILVSAAAGSGKTAVLVERIIKMVTDNEEPTDIDRILTATFTEAAAAEMKERIRAALEKAYEEEPGDERLERQISLIHAAMISTIHGFCLSVIKDHFHVIGLDPSFRTAEEGELKLLMRDVLEEFLEDRYREGDASFLEFTEKYAEGKDDRKIEELILNLYKYSRSYPEPEKWLGGCAGVYKKGSVQYEGRVLEFAAQKADDIVALIKEAQKICEEPDGPYMHLDAVSSDVKIAKSLKNAGSYRELYDIVANIKWQSLSSKKDESVNAEKRMRVRELREKVKNIMKDFARNYFYDEPAVIQEDMESSAMSVSTLIDLVKGFGRAFAEKKREKNIIDFTDMEQFAYGILVENKDGELMPSDAAKEYQRRFKEVMIDEYQDINFIQESILNSVSTSGRGRNNIFMVGDVKQSIYGFRLSRPELFMEKYDNYSTAGGSRVRVDLHKNFRSRREVIDSVNFIFRRIMRRGLGNVDYDEDAFLNGGARFPSVCDEAGSLFKTEILIVDMKENMARGEGALKEEPLVLEAKCIAKKIKELLRNGRVTDEKSGELRRPRFSDIVILTRSVKALEPVFMTALKDEGIPTYSISGEGYFETYEVSILLDYLMVLDNFRQDLPLTAVLTSPIAGFHAEELAKIRTAFPDMRFYKAVQSYALDESGGSDDEIRLRLKKFLEQLNSFREMTPFIKIHELLRHITEETGYGTYISAMPGGAKRAANLKMLAKKASDFEKTTYRGLFNFIRYIEQLKKYDFDYGEADILTEQSDAVRVTTIHKSKGLEFPIVFLAGTSKRFNMNDTKGSIVIHSKWGVGINTVDLEKRTKAPTIIKKIIQEEISRESLGEELRVLYVAMTRAKEKLIITGSLGDAEKRIAKEQAGLKESFGVSPLPYYVLSSASSYMDWLLPAALTAGGDIPLSLSVFSTKELRNEDCAKHAAGVLAKDILENWDAGEIYDEDIKKQIDEQLKFVYPYKAGRGEKMKFSVSELKDLSYTYEGAPESVREMFEEERPLPLLPKFAREETIPGGAYIGTAYHRVMEILDFTEDYDEKYLAAKIAEFEKDGRLEAEAAKAVRPRKILLFLNGSLGRRARRAAEAGRLKREQPFVMEVEASRIYPDSEGREKILVQGVIDAYFEEDGALVLLDYKTDKAKDGSELKDRYREQLRFYAEALARLTGKEVREIYIYSFHLAKEISLKNRCTNNHVSE